MVGSATSDHHAAILRGLGAAAREYGAGGTCRARGKIAGARSRTDRLFDPSAVHGTCRRRSPQAIIAVAGDLTRERKPAAIETDADESDRVGMSLGEQNSGDSEEAELLGAVADQHVLGLLVVVEHHLVGFAADARLLVAAERRMCGIGVIAAHNSSTDR